MEKLQCYVCNYTVKYIVLYPQKLYTKVLLSKCVRKKYLQGRVVVLCIYAMGKKDNPYRTPVKLSTIFQTGEAQKYTAIQSFNTLDK